jgi:hypothetical protein
MLTKISRGKNRLLGGWSANRKLSGSRCGISPDNLPAHDSGTRSQRSFDLVGFLTLSPSLVLFLYGSDHLNKREGLVMLLLSVVLLATSLPQGIERRPESVD